MKTKLDQLREMMQAERWRDALKLAASWSDADVVVKRAWEGACRPDFMRQLGRDPDALVASGIAALRARFER